MATSAATEIEISSLAAQLCGEEPFTTYASAGPMGKAAESMYNNLVPGELGSQKWRFALANGVVNTFTSIPTSEQLDGWAYKGNLPQDLLVLHAVYPYCSYRRWGPTNGFPIILTRGDTALNIEYSVDVPVNLWPTPFKMYIAYRLALMISTSSTRSDNLYAKLKPDLESWKEKAEFADSQQEPQENFQDRPYQRERYYRRGHYGT